MTNRELDAKCAEIMGWAELSFSSPADMREGVTWLHGVMPNGTYRNAVPLYSTSLDASRELLKWAMDHFEDYLDRYQSKFSLALLARLKIPYEFPIGDIMQSVLQLTPRQICEAFVECFGGHNDPI